MMKRTLLSIAALCILLLAQAQNPEKAKLITGPVVGAVTKTSAKVWIAYRGDGLNMVTLQDTATEEIHYPTGFKKTNDSKGNFSLVMDFTDLKPGHTYKPKYAFSLLSPRPRCIITTPEDVAVKDVEFLVGSCALLNTDWSRFMFPGFSVNIFNIMKRERSDFMLWLGDNVYYFSKHYNSYDGMFNRNLKIRNEFLSLTDFLAKQPNYAIWDDHDYGWNDADKTFPLKDTALKVFKSFWPNPYDEQDSTKGNLFTFRYYDAEFFMTDDRWYRDPEGDSTGAFLGMEQVKWLQEKLKNSDATFKFVCVGSQVLNECYYGESYAKYPVERRALLDYIAENNIPGVIFLTGDKHYTELSKRDWKGYPMYDFTSSPLTSPVVPVKHIKGYQNVCLLPETGYYKKNYGKISLSGPADNRVCKMEIYGKSGKKRWEYKININDIKKK